MPNPVTKVLLVEDNPGDARLVREALADVSEFRCEVIHRETRAEALAFLATSQPDVILSDLGLPDSQGLQIVREISEAAPHAPLVLLTALDDKSLAMQSLEEGAQDYLIKSEIDGVLLSHALRYAMKRQRVQVDRLSVALIDDLTGLNNRRGFLTLAKHHVKLACRTGRPFLLAFADVDGLKHINDTLGHQEGNRALVEAADVLRDCFRQSDILARLGGDEFAILIADATESSISTVTHRVQHKLDSYNARPCRRYRLSFSIGIVAGTAQPPDLEKLLQDADALMYQQKRERGVSREAAKLDRENRGYVEQAPN